jgi:GalNAc-alpha-(1->4)-GalNAc-alpha-(1->3)-diNAcBac-PP-undecaprenol alpha-1,4-N-acetyl-D-galactosaminyltransferase
METQAGTNKPVLIVGSVLGTGGAQHQQGVLKDLLGQGADVVNLPPCLRFPSSIRFILRVLWLRRLICRNPPSAVVLWQTPPILLGFFLPRRGIKLVGVERSNPLPSLTGFRRFFYCLSAQRLHRLVVQTEPLREQLVDLCDVNAMVIPNGISKDLEAAVNLGREAPLELKILFAGRLVPGKCADLVLKAFSLSNPPNPWRLEIIGDGPELKNLLETADNLGISDRVDFKSRLSHADLLKEMRKSAIFAFSSFREGYPNALLEAAILGNGVISTACDFGPTTILEGRPFTKLVPVGDLRCFARGLNELVDLYTTSWPTNEQLDLWSLAKISELQDANLEWSRLLLG